MELRHGMYLLYAALNAFSLLLIISEMDERQSLSPSFLKKFVVIRICYSRFHFNRIFLATSNIFNMAFGMPSMCSPNNELNSDRNLLFMNKIKMPKVQHIDTMKRKSNFDYQSRNTHSFPAHSIFPMLASTPDVGVKEPKKTYDEMNNTPRPLIIHIRLCSYLFINQV